MKYFKNLSLLVFLIFVNLSLTAQTPAACLNFDGNDDYVNLPNNGGVFNVGSNHIKTVQFWYKSTNTSGSHVRIFSTGSSGWTSGIWLGFSSGSNFLMLEMSDGVSSGIVVTSTVSSRGDNNWHHATAVLNGGIAMLYLDGILQNTGNISGEGAMPSSGAVHIGNSYNNESASNFNGTVDELRIWDRILCGSEILNTKNCELTGNEIGLVAYYQFNQGVFNTNNSSITTLNSSVTVVNTGTLTNFTLSGLTSNWTQPSAVTTGNTCSLTSAFSLSVSSANPNICTGQSATLTASGAGTYTWYPGVLTGNSITISPSVSTNYSVYGINGNGCLGNANYSVSVSSSNLIVASTNNNLCSGQPATLTASGANTYTWYPGTLTGNSIIVNPSISTNYSVFGTNIFGCIGSNSLSLNVHNTSLTITPSHTLICPGQTATLSASGGSSSYNWALPQSVQSNSIVVSPTVNSIYLVYAVNGFCQAMGSFTLNVSTVSISVFGALTICEGQSTTFTANGANTYTWLPIGTTSNVAVLNPTIATIYSVIGTNSLGCTGNASFSINVNQNPILNITSDKTEICSGNTAILNVNGASNYTWSPIISSNNLVYVNPAQTTTYYVTGMNSNGCSSSASIALMVNTCVGMNVHRNFEAIKVYPNPVINTLKVEGLPDSNSSLIQITNLLGEIIYSNLVIGREVDLNFADYSSGFYILKITSENKTLKSYIVKQ